MRDVSDGGSEASFIFSTGLLDSKGGSAASCWFRPAHDGKYGGIVIIASSPLGFFLLPGDGSRGHLRTGFFPAISEQR